MISGGSFMPRRARDARAFKEIDEDIGDKRA